MATSPQDGFTPREDSAPVQSKTRQFLDETFSAMGINSSTIGKFLFDKLKNDPAVWSKFIDTLEEWFHSQSQYGASGGQGHSNGTAKSMDTVYALSYQHRDGQSDMLGVFETPKLAMDAPLRWCGEWQVRPGKKWQAAATKDGLEFYWVSPFRLGLNTER